MSTSPTQLRGSISFVEDDAVKIATPIIRDDRIAFDFDYGSPGLPEVYSVVLVQTGEDRFEGQFTITKGSGRASGTVTCRKYTGASGTFLTGAWLEHGERYLWFAEFPVETSKPPSPS